MVTDTVSDLFTRIRNAQRAGHKGVRIPQSKMAGRVLAVLKKEGFIESFETKKDRENKFDEIEVTLKYFAKGDPAITSARRVSTPGSRQYASGDKLPRVSNGLGIVILSTSQGVMSDREAKKRKIGGEILALIG